LDKLRESEERFATAFKANPQPMTLTRLADGRFVDVNKAFLDVTGYNRDEVVGHTAVELRIWETPAVRDDFIQQLKEGRSLVNVEKRIRTKDGSFRLLLMSAERVEVGGDECVLVGSTDITERKRVEEALKESEARLTLAQQGARMGTFEWNVQTGVNIWSPELEAMSGLEPG